MTFQSLNLGLNDYLREGMSHVKDAIELKYKAGIKQLDINGIRVVKVLAAKLAS